MALLPQIALQGQPPQIPLMDLGRTVMQAAQLKDLGQQQQVRQLALEQALQQRDRRAALQRYMVSLGQGGGASADPGMVPLNSLAPPVPGEPLAIQGPPQLPGGTPWQAGQDTLSPGALSRMQAGPGTTYARAPEALQAPAFQTRPAPTSGGAPGAGRESMLDHLDWRKMYELGGEEGLALFDTVRQYEMGDAATRMKLLTGSIGVLDDLLGVIHDQKSLDSARAGLERIPVVGMNVADVLPKVYESKEQFAELRKQLVPMKQRLQSQQAGLQIQMLRDPSGNLVPGQATAAGTIDPSKLPPGYSYVGPTQVLDTKTDLLIQPKAGGPPLQTIPKQVREAEFLAEQGKGEGKAAAERPQRQREAQTNLAALDQKHARVTSWIDEAMALAEQSWTATGLIGGLSKAVPGTPSFELNKILGSIRANLGLDELQNLKQSGVGLGSVTEAEHRLLQELMGILEQGLPKEKFLETLRDLKAQMQTNRARRLDAYERDFGAAPPPAGAPGQSGRLPDKTMSAAQVRELALRRGISEDEVRQRAEASGYRITP